MSEQRIGTCIIVLDSNKLVLLGVRKNGYFSGHYGMPGGHLEVNEGIEACALRELYEETGIRAKQLTYIGVVLDAQATYDFVHFVFTTEIASDLPQRMEPEKNEGWEWHSQIDLPKNILAGHAGAIRLLRENKQLVEVTSVTP